MIFSKNKHNTTLYNTLLYLSRNLYFYDKISLTDTYETRVYLMFIHFSVILHIFKTKKIKFSQDSYDSLFHSIENNLRELGQGDVAVNKKMKDLNKIFYDILLKIIDSGAKVKFNKNLIIKYFENLNDLNEEKYQLFEVYLEKFYHFCFDIHPEIMIKEAINFKVK
tara:strand:- start:40 stop:537 length:498 start_codon:yes stop_codon:yes gene_type:complete